MTESLPIFGSIAEPEAAENEKLADDVMLADQIDAARLGAFVAGFLDKPHLVIDLEFVKIRADDAVAMKIDLAAQAVSDFTVGGGRIQS